MQVKFIAQNALWNARHAGQVVCISHPDEQYRLKRWTLAQAQEVAN